MKFGVIVFPGSNCDYDAYWVAREVLGEEAQFLWHQDTSLGSCDCVILPGGFSYGDYLRTGAIAKFSPIMKKVIQFAKEGGLVVGICNGFQILLEAGLLPGAMLRNRDLRFICKYVYLKVENNNTPFTCYCQQNQVLKVPIAHGDGNYHISDEGFESLSENDQIVLRYCDPGGRITEEANANGSSHNIAGICNKERNVFAMMPHPERCSEEVLGSRDGLYVFESITKHLAKRWKS